MIRTSVINEAMPRAIIATRKRRRDSPDDPRMVPINTVGVAIAIAADTSSQ
jgi:hypothetical protein